MKFWRIVVFLCAGILVIMALAYFLPSTGIGRLMNLGRTNTDEFCKECGLFRKATYSTFFIKSFEIESEYYNENGIKVLHDAFFTPCEKHKWCIFHLTRGSVRFKGKSEPRLNVGFEAFKHFKNQTMKDFILSKPALASQAAVLVFDFSNRGKSYRLLSDLSIAIDLDDEEDIAATLASMVIEIGLTK